MTSAIPCGDVSRKKHESCRWVGGLEDCCLAKGFPERVRSAETRSIGCEISRNVENHCAFPVPLERHGWPRLPGGRGREPQSSDNENLFSNLMSRSAGTAFSHRTGLKVLLFARRRWPA